MSDKISIVILAAGKGTRLKLDIPKPLAPVENKTLIDYVVKASKDIGDLSLIVGHQSELLENHFKEKYKNLNFNFYLQEEQLGTGHAVKTYFDKAKNAEEYKYTIVMCADTPLITKDILDELIVSISDNDAVAATFTEPDPKGLGRIMRFDKGFKIVEEKDASESQRLITEVNSALYIFKTSFLKEKVYGLKSKNKANEFYLTDAFEENGKVVAKHFSDKNSFLGVNDLYQLSRVDALLRKRNMRRLLDDGVRIIDPSHTYVYSENIGEGSIISPNVHIDSLSKIGRNVVVEPGCIIKNSLIEDGVQLKAYTYITDSVVKTKAKIGPMAQLRPQSEIGANSKLGNFVEIKKSKVKENSSISHLSYVGDAEIGSNVNIGCGFITCNYDGANKHKTVIGDNSFIGSDCQVIAPLEIGENTYVGSGSTINQNIPDGAFAIARSRQVTKESMAKRFMKKKD